MKTSLYAFMLVAILAGCAQQQPPSTSASGAPPSGMTGFDARMCQTVRGYMGRGEDDKVKEACVRQLGAEGCRQCMSGM